MVNAIPGAPKSAAPWTTSCLMISVYGRHFRLQAGTNADLHRVYGNGASCALSPHVCAPHPTKRAPCAPLARPSRADCPLGRPALLRLPFGAARLPFGPAVWRCAVPTAAPPPAGVPSASLDTSPCALPGSRTVGGRPRPTAPYPHGQEGCWRSPRPAAGSASSPPHAPHSCVCANCRHLKMVRKYALLQSVSWTSPSQSSRSVFVIDASLLPIMRYKHNISPPK